MKVVTILILTHLCASLAYLEEAKGLYVSNGTHILFLKENISEAAGLETDAIPVYGRQNSRITGLAIDIREDLLFWSDASAGNVGIYKAKLTKQGKEVSNVETIIDSDLVQVNGVAVNWQSKHIYWTDAKKKTIEVAEYDGAHRRVLGIQDLVAPRGIYCDPVSGYLFWADQGKKIIGRSRPDGSEQRTIVSQNIYLPNQIVVYQSKLSWVDSYDKIAWRSELDGSNMEKLASISDLTLGSNIFGITYNRNRVYVSAWEKGAVVSFDSLSTAEDKSLVSVVPYRLGTAMFSMVYYDSSSNMVQPAAPNNPCDPGGNKNGCSHLCLPTGLQMARCSCPSYGGITLQSDGKTCREPQQILLYALAQQGAIGYSDLDNPSHPDLYLIGRSLRPVAVAYDSAEKMVYWSDVHERRIHRAKLDGSEHKIFLSSVHGIGIVDGLALDVPNRKLYFANLGRITTDDATYMWHKIEAVDLEGTHIRTIVTNVEKPRALWVDSSNGLLYYTDWGQHARLMRCNLDGSDDVTLKTGLDNPNAVVTDQGQVYVVDSHYKSRLPSYPHPAKNATVSQVMSEGEQWTDWTLQGLQTPFGLALNPKTQQFYVSDWETKSIMVMTFNSKKWSQAETVLENVDTPMGLLYTMVSTTTGDVSPCVSQTACDEVCFADSDGSETVCACSSYGGNVLQNDQTSCSVPHEFLLFADMTSIKMIGYDSKDQSVYTAVRGLDETANFVAVTYDADQKGIYYTEVGRRTRRGIYFSKLDDGQSQKIYGSNSVIDGLTLDSQNRKLYWSDYLGGQILSMSLTSSDQTPKLVAEGLDSPRAVAIDRVNGYLYWTEWGKNPRVARASLRNLSHVETVTRFNLQQPSGLDVDTKNNKLYIGDGYYKTIIECDLDGFACRDLAYIRGVAQHVFAVARVGNLLYYTDWVQRTVTQVDMETGHVKYPAQNLMRPSGIFIQYTAPPACPSSEQCNHECSPVPGGYQCQCHLGHELDTDEKTCIPGPEWRKADQRSCDPGCWDNEVCAQRVGGRDIVFQCQCVPGFQVSAVAGVDNCEACPVNKYKSVLDDTVRCAWCPGSGIQTPAGSKECACQTGQYWLPDTDRCSGNKQGECPAKVSARFQCHEESPCITDSDCPGAKKCCRLESPCDSHQCVDPLLNSKQCVYNGTIYDVGDNFHPDKCSSCECTYSKSLTMHSEYATTVCVINECPVLLCSEEHHIKNPEECCAKCSPPRYQTPNLTIDNCPQDQTIVLTLSPDERYAKHNFYIQPLDRTALARSINITKTPPGRYYEWGQEVTVRWTAAAQRPSGKWDVVSCTYSIRVIDTQPPSITCPEDIMVYTANQTAAIQWLLPRANDNVGLQLNDPHLIKGKSWGSQFVPGKYSITYGAADLAKHEEDCSFDITVQQLLWAKCEVKSPLHGKFSCVEGKTGIVACEMHCYKEYGYVLNPKYKNVYKYECSDGNWSPQLPNHYMVESCIEIDERTLQVSQDITYPQCIAGLDSVDAQHDLQDRLKRHFLGPPELSGHREQLNVTLNSTCSDRADEPTMSQEIKITIMLSVKYRTTDELKLLQSQLQNKIREITSTVVDRTFFLIRPSSVPAHQYTMPATPVIHSDALRLGQVKVTSGCLEGQEEMTAGCIICPPGMYGDGDVCEPCSMNTYQDISGQTSCLPCSNKTTAPEASYSHLFCRNCQNLEQCSETALKSTQRGGVLSIMVIGIIVGVTVFVILVIIIVTVIIVKRLRRKQLTKDKDSPQNSTDLSFSNPMFSEDQQVTIAQNPNGGVNNNAEKISKGGNKGSVRSIGSTSSAMARAYPDMPEKEVEMGFDNGNIDLITE